ncbi:DNA-binding protein [Candidatus Bathyarchaeota archaeon]|nr:DNA-binding protein [Candidatus Bathyarchaeota archaeon]
MKIGDLRQGMKRVDVEAKVLEVSEPREVQSRYTGQRFKVAEAIITDGTGTIKLVLWNDQIDLVNTDDIVRIENGYVKTFRGEIQLNVGRYGKLTVLHD